VKQHEFENLVRAAIEAHELDRAARDLASPDAGPGAIPFPPIARRRPLWLDVAATVSAAAAVLALAWLPPSLAPHRAAYAQPEVEISYLPGTPQDDGVRIDCFESSASEPVSAVAVLHTWHDDCQCLQWDVYEWENGRPLTSLSPHETHEIAVDVTGAPPVEQLVVLVVARDRSGLPADEEQAGQLLECLNDIAPPGESCEDAYFACLRMEDSYPEMCEGMVACAPADSAVWACLPEGITVVQRPFSTGW
jgi:hypothetical protein